MTAPGPESFLDDARRRVQQRLAELLPDGGAIPRLPEAMCHAVLAGGKRIRPLLVLASAQACGATALEATPRGARLLDAACAVELIHTFSLVHDDLPALDDDTLRRGRPTLHVQFDEATAILAGDALLNLAFELLARGDDAAVQRLSTVRVFATAVGLSGMIGGQVLDLDAENGRIEADALHRIHRLKTGALITACCEAGGVLAEAAPAALERLRRYGAQIGLAFQIVDDVLDVEGSAEDLGKSPGKDARSGKTTFPSLWGVEGSRARAAACVEEALAAIRPFGDAASPLESIARTVLARRG
jgi:geranylgeranyl pyrophosphate synthase